MIDFYNADDFDSHEQVVMAYDRASGLKAVIAVHDTTLGPAVGGCRMWSYADSDEAVIDALRLSRGMTYKSAVAGVPFGGGKSVIIGDARTQKSPKLMAAMAEAVDRLAGRYYMAEDVGTSVDDMEVVRKRTKYVAGLRDLSGDPSPATARGTFQGIKAAVRHKLGRDDLNGLTVAVQGLGHVGMTLCGLLRDTGANLIVADLNDEAVAEAQRTYGAEACDPDRIHAADVDVYAPCALGATINDETIPELRCAVVAGCANNQLAEARHGGVLNARGILYAPDYVVNAGGIIQIAYEPTFSGRAYDQAAAYAHVDRIGGTLDRIFQLADEEGLTTAAAADRMAMERLDEGRSKGLAIAAE